MRTNGYDEISECGRYRYKLGGNINSVNADLLTQGGSTDIPILWIMLNPSTATAQNWGGLADATIRTITMFSETWGFGRMMIGNLYGFRATDPRDLVAAWRSGVDIVGPRNAEALAEMCAEVRGASGKIMVAWGTGPKSPTKLRIQHALHFREVRGRIGGDLHCLRMNGDSSPVHPLYQPHHLVPQLWSSP